MANPTPPPKPPGWTYNRQLQTYRKGNRGVTSRWLTTARDQAVAGNAAAVDALSARLSIGEINVQQWVKQFRTLLKDTYLQQYMLGRGGVEAMTQADYGRVGQMLRKQYGYMDQFAREIASGNLSPGQIAYRSRLYMNSATQAYEAARAANRGLRLPAYPGDGTTRCGTNCKCAWRIVRGEREYLCYWQLGRAEHCEDCVNRASRWNPLIISR